ncbi:MAG: apolipoprotein N-acyltransferase, partial [Gammaproteobacteria bacterium]|nr:apolipoprotein N-acyltransferase [Gammaproteobacteria bacterium]
MRGLHSSSYLDLVLAFALGVISSFAFAPYTYVLAAVPAFSVFILLVFNRPSRAFLYGLLYGLGQFFFAFHWLMPSMTEFGQIPVATAYAIFFAVCAEVALYPALFAYVLSKLSNKLDWSSLLLVPALWVLTEWLRSNMFPFAWNLIGYSFYPYETLLQISDIASVYLLSFLFVFFSTSLALIYVTSADLPRRGSMVFFLMASVFTFVWVYGEYKIDNLSQKTESSSRLNVAAVQGNIAQNEKWQKGANNKVLDTYKDISQMLPDEVELIVWPESSLPFMLQDNKPALQQLKNLAAIKKADLLIGADTYREEGRNKEFFNSMLMINPDQGVVSQYDKFHRVPFGEYMPLKEYLPASLAGFSLSDGFSSVQAGSGVAVMPWRGLNLAPLICYESIFPRH